MPQYKIKCKHGGKTMLYTVKAPNREAAEKAVKEGKDGQS